VRTLGWGDEGEEMTEIESEREKIKAMKERKRKKR
jgi:hypothetical protein